MRRWLLDHPISGPRVGKAPDDGHYGIRPDESVWAVAVPDVLAVVEEAFRAEAANPSLSAEDAIVSALRTAA